MQGLAQTVPVPGDISVIADSFDLSTITAADLIFAGVALVGGVVLGQLAKRAVRRLLDIDGLPDMAGDIIARIVGYVILLLGVVVGLEALGFSLGPVGSIIILVVVALVFAAKPLLQDLGAGLILQIRHPFLVGDQVVIAERRGQVDEISARTVRILTVDGHRFHVPDRTVLGGTITNLVSHGLSMSTFTAGAE